MNASGVIYVAIVAAWFAVLVPRWLRRNEEVERAREVDESRGVRVIEPRATRMRARSRSARAVVRQPVPAPPRSDHAARLAFRAGARRRRRVLLLLVLATAGVGVAAVVEAIPPLWVAVPAALLVAFGVLARRAAAAERRRLSAGDDAAEDDAVVDDARAAAEDIESEPVVAAMPMDDGPEAADVDTDEWEPVSVPPPIYVTKARAERAANRSIDLSGAGAWTSTRLDAAGDIVLPRRDSAHRSAPGSAADPTAVAAHGGGHEWWDDRGEFEYRPAVGE
ncbi:MAG TPA: hypothetical protein VK053_02665 [Jiangellaceae bacterium]|nr:hypothetical protein [Jiangellaceae bacterium]